MGRRLGGLGGNERGQWQSRTLILCLRHGSQGPDVDARFLASSRAGPGGPEPPGADPELGRAGRRARYLDDSMPTYAVVVGDGSATAGACVWIRGRWFLGGHSGRSSPSGPTVQRNKIRTPRRARRPRWLVRSPIASASLANPVSLARHLSHFVGGGGVLQRLQPMPGYPS